MAAHTLHLALALAFALVPSTAATASPGLESTPGASRAPREVVPFDYGWRFKMTEPPHRTGCPPFTDATNTVCGGLETTKATTMAECRQACCDNPTCYVYQFKEPASDPHAGCWTGVCRTPLHSSKGWDGGHAPAPAPPPTPGPPPPESRPGFDDAAWEVLNAPHDYIILQNYSNVTGTRKTGYFPRANAWYRKHFKLPTAWAGGLAWLHFDGVYKVATVFVNGALVVTYGGSNSGYTGFWIRLDNITGVAYGEPAVIAIEVDGSYGTEHWYAGAGLYRSMRLVRTNPVHIVQDSPYAASIVSPGNLSLATFYPRALVENLGAAPFAGTLTFSVGGEGGAVSSVRMPLSIPGRTVVNATAVLRIERPHLWSIQDPFTYATNFTLTDAAGAGVDEVGVTTGVRAMEWRPQGGFWLNNAHVKLRGFCHHDDFTGVGMAMPDRIWLYRAMATRGIGGNAWRFSHNNYRPSVYDILDNAGIVVWDENRDLAWSGRQGLDAMVRSHRNHPSIVVWSFCNEGGCTAADNQTLGQEFRRIAKANDPFRAVSGNMVGSCGNGTLSDVLDVQGCSHPSPSSIARVHAATPTKAFIASECCSCRSQRGEYAVDSSPAAPHFSAFNADCLQDQVNRTDGLDFVVGSMIWTLGDYFGEPTPFDWPMVSSSFGALDLAGFPKAGAHWYQAWWLLAAQPSPTRPPLPAGHAVHIVETADMAGKPAGGANTTFHVYSSSPAAELFLNGASLGRQGAQEWMGWREWSTPFTGGTLRAVAYDGDGHPVATHEVATAGAAAALVLSIDVPAPSTGTGTAVVLDGHDVALVRATVVDAAGRTVTGAANNVSFAIVSGPGRVLGVGNGDPSCHEPNQVPWRSAYHGLVRGIIKVTEDWASPPAARRLMGTIDTDGARSPVSVINPDSPPPAGPQPIVVRASSPGLRDATVTVQVSTDAARDGVVAAARRYRTEPFVLQ